MESLSFAFAFLTPCCRATTDTQALREAATAYKVDTDAIALKVKQEFAAKVKAKTEKKAKPKATTKTLKKTA